MSTAHQSGPRPLLAVEKREPCLTLAYRTAPAVGNAPLMAHFHCRVRNGSDRKGAGRIAFPPPKVGVTRTLPYPFRPHFRDSSVAVPKTRPDA